MYSFVGSLSVLYITTPLRFRWATFWTSRARDRDIPRNRRTVLFPGHCKWRMRTHVHCQVKTMLHRVRGSVGRTREEWVTNIITLNSLSWAFGQSGREGSMYTRLWDLWSRSIHGISLMLDERAGAGCTCYCSGNFLGVRGYGEFGAREQGNIKGETSGGRYSSCQCQIQVNVIFVPREW